MNKICNFYINDAHLSVVLFEYIKRQVNDGTKIIVVTQDNKKMNMKSLKEKFNKAKMESKIDFLNEESINKLYDNENITIIIKGNNKFISKIENNFTRLFREENINIDILSCYNIKDSDISEISSQYNQILNTKGICDLCNMDESKLQKI